MTVEQRTKKNKATMLLELKRSRGIVSPACEVAGINRQTHYNYLKDDPEYKEAVEEIEEACLDFVEGKMQQLIEGYKLPTGRYDEFGDPIFIEQPPSQKMIEFYQKTKGRKRGYTERIEHTGADGAPLAAPVVSVFNGAPVDLEDGDEVATPAQPLKEVQVDVNEDDPDDWMNI